MIPRLFIHFFFVTRAAKKKFPKRNAVFRLRGGRCYAQSATFEKVDETIALVCADFA